MVAIASTQALSVGQTIAAGAPGPDHPPVETTGKDLLNLDNAGPVQMGFWVPNRIYATVKYLAPLRRHVASLPPTGLHPVVAAFKDWVTANSVYRMWVHAMIEQANNFVALHQEDQVQIQQDGDTLWISDYGEFFHHLSVIIQTSPSFNNTAQVGTPMNGFLAVGMGTQAGAALFHDTTFNLEFKKVLMAWNAFLKSPDSLDKLDIADPEKHGSWISKAAHAAGVWEEYVYDPTQAGYGFDSWNGFFIRKFKQGARPFDGDGNQVVNIGCETTPWAYMNHANRITNFWVKDVQYSLLDLFGGRSDEADRFAGGQIYQGFLSATHYHRWNCPIDGQLIEAWLEPGTYFAQRPAQGEDEGTWEGTESQPYLAHVATRAIFIFKHPVCGFMAMILIGMVEVSTCVIEDKFLQQGALPCQVQRGEELGHFEFGGSTHVLVFQKDKVQLADWAVHAASHQNDPQPQKMGSVIATAL